MKIFFDGALFGMVMTIGAFLIWRRIKKLQRPWKEVSRTRELSTTGRGKEAVSKPEKAPYTMIKLESLGMVYEDIVAGWRARYRGKDFFILDGDQFTFLLATGDVSYEDEGFIRNGKNGVFYKIIDRNDAEEFFYLKATAVYCGIECGVSAIRHEKDGKVRLIVYHGEEINETDLYEKGFIKKEEGSHGHNYIIYELITSLDDLNLEIVKKKLEPAPYRLTGDIQTDVSTREKWIDFLAKKINEPWYEHHISKILLGLYGYAIPSETYSTDMSAVMNEVIPKAFELQTKNMDISCEEFQRIAKKFWQNVLDGIFNCDFVDLDKNVCWRIGHNRIFFRCDYERYVIYMKLKYYDMYLGRIKEKKYPYTYAGVGNTNHWLNVYGKKWMDMSGPVYWGDKLICEDFNGYVQDMLKKFEKEYGMAFDF